MRYKKLLFGSFFSIVLISFLLFIINRNAKQIEILYIKVFKKTVSLVQKNSKGQMDGKAFFYKEGTLSQEGNFINGLKQGWMTRYNENGGIEWKIYYNQDKEDGNEYEYYGNGRLKYTGHWKNGKRFGSLLYNDENGKPRVYHAYNILGEKFNIISYDELGNISKLQGFAVSSKIYSFRNDKDSLVILKDHGTYENIKDLFLTVATPPNVHFSIAIGINNIQQHNLVIKDNTVLISNALDKKGDYIITLHEQIQDKKNKLLDDSSFQITIKKK